MKKLILSLATATTVLLTSCTSDPINWSEPQANPTITPAQIPGVNLALPDAWELSITGNTLNYVKINNNLIDAFTYDSGRIIKITHSQNSSETGYDVLAYNSNGTLMSITSKNSTNVMTSTRVFNYNNPNSIEEVVTIYNTTSGAVQSTYSVNKTILNGNLVKYEHILGAQTDTNTYDNKQNVFSNLSCLNELILYYSNDKVSKNNRISSTSVFTYNGSVINTQNRNYSNQYDQNNRIIKTTINYIDANNNYSYLQNYTY